MTLYKDFGVIFLPESRLSLSLRHIPQRPHPPARNKPAGLNPFHRCACSYHNTRVTEQTNVILQRVNEAFIWCINLAFLLSGVGWGVKYTLYNHLSASLWLRNIISTARLDYVTALHTRVHWRQLDMKILLGTEHSSPSASVNQQSRTPANASLNTSHTSHMTLTLIIVLKYKLSRSNMILKHNIVRHLYRKPSFYLL